MKYRHLLLHTCRCMVLKCLNSNPFFNPLPLSHSGPWLLLAQRNPSVQPPPVFPRPSAPLHPLLLSRPSAAQATAACSACVARRLAEADGRAPPVISYLRSDPSPSPARGRAPPLHRLDPHTEGPSAYLNPRNPCRAAPVPLNPKPSPPPRPVSRNPSWPPP
jgi:hypothetical protein